MIYKYVVHKEPPRQWLFTPHSPSQSRVLIGLAKLPAHRLRMNLSDLLIHRGLLQPLHLRCRQC